MTLAEQYPLGTLVRREKEGCWAVGTILEVVAHGAHGTDPGRTPRVWLAIQGKDPRPSGDGGTARYSTDLTTRIHEGFYRIVGHTLPQLPRAESIIGLMG